MNSRHRQTLAAIYRSPVPSSLRWQAIEALIAALGGEVIAKTGSVVAFILKDRRAVFHRPHPSPEAKKGQVRKVRRFLEAAGVSHLE